MKLIWNHQDESTIEFGVAEATDTDVREIEACDGRRSASDASKLKVGAAPACYLRHESDHTNFAILLWVDHGQMFFWRSEPEHLPAEELQDLAALERVSIV